MAFDPTLPVEHTPLDAAQMRAQFNGLKAIIDDLTAQLAPLVPVLTRDGSGNWTLAYQPTAPEYWQIWARNDTHPGWFNWSEVAFAGFPLGDGDMTPGGIWWQVKIAGENDLGIACTPFSNVVSFGSVP